MSENVTRDVKYRFIVSRKLLVLSVCKAAADLDRRGINRAERVARGDDQDRAETAALCSAKLRHKAVRAGQRRGPGDAIRSGPGR